MLNLVEGEWGSETVLPPSEAAPLCSWTSRPETHCVHVNTGDPTEVKIVVGFILPQQSRPRLGQKQYLDMAADVPKQAWEDRPAGGTRGMAGLWGAVLHRQKREPPMMMISFFLAFVIVMTSHTVISQL